MKRVPLPLCVLFNLVYPLWFFAFGLAILPFSLISRKLGIALVRPWAGSVLFWARICGITWEVRGREHISQTPVIYASKHQSAMDIFMLFTALRAPVFVLKKELVWIPVLGFYCWWFGMIPIDRKGGMKSLKAMLARATNTVQDLRSIVIFPEGTRSTPPDANPYQPGTALLYDNLKIPVVPVALSSGAFWPKGGWRKYSGKAVVEFLPPIPPGLPKREFLAALEQSVETASKKLYDEALTKGK